MIAFIRNASFPCFHEELLIDSSCSSSLSPFSFPTGYSIDIDIDIYSIQDIVQTLLEYPGRVKRALAEMLEFTEACRADGLCFELGAGSDEDDEREGEYGPTMPLPAFSIACSSPIYAPAGPTGSVSALGSIVPSPPCASNAKSLVQW